MAKRNEGWLVRSWRPLSAAVYLFICVFDFVLMPIWYEYVHQKDYSPMQIIELITRLGGDVAQVEGLKILTEQQRWSPITLGETGLFHVAFGAILGASAWTRGMEKTSRFRSPFGNGPYDEPYYSQPPTRFELPSTPFQQMPPSQTTVAPTMTPVRGENVDDPDA